MPVIAVANPKGGVGKSTLAMNVAGFFASQGHTVALGDLDPQQSSRLWRSLRPATARPIADWETPQGAALRAPRDASHAVLDTPAGLHGAALKEVLRLADKVLVPLQPSVFDIFATRSFLDELAAHRQAASTRIGIVGMRVDGRTIAADKLQEFVEGLGLPVLGMLRDTQNYVHLAAQGLSLFDVAPGRVARDLEQWRPVCDWLAAD